MAIKTSKRRKTSATGKRGARGLSKTSRKLHAATRYPDGRKPASIFVPTRLRLRRPVPSDIEIAQEAKLKPKDFTDQQKGMISAFNRYICYIHPAATDQQGQEQLVEVKYARSRTYFEAQHWEEAAIAFRDGRATGARAEVEGRTALDEVVQMMGGLAYMTGPEGRPLRAGSSVIDILGGTFAALGIVAALRERDTTGKGKRITSSLFETTALLVAQHMAQYELTGEEPPPMSVKRPAWGAGA